MTHFADSSTASTNPLFPTWPEFIIGTILFFLIFGVLAKLLMPRIQQTLTERTEQIEGGLARSEEAQAGPSSCSSSTGSSSPRPGTRRPGCARMPGSRARGSSPRCASRPRPRRAG